MLGLTLALRLAARGAQVEVIEAAPVLGGLTAGFRYESVTWDRFYHVIEGGDRHLLALLDELDLTAELVMRRTRTGYFDGTALYPLDNAMDFLRLPGLGLAAKLRLGLNILYGASRRDLLALEAVPAIDWLRRWSGEQALQGLWLPLLRAKLGSNASRVSAAWIAAVMQRFHGAREGVSQTERFGYVRGGYTRIIDALKARIEAAGGRIRTGCPVASVTAGDGGLQVRHAGGSDQFDRVVATFSSDRLPAIVPDLPASERQQHAAIDWQGVVCQSLLLRRPLGGAYLTYLLDPALPFTTVIEMSALVPTDELGGHHLVYLPRYVDARDPLFDEADEAIAARFLAGLGQVFPDLCPDDVVTSRIARARQVLALPTLHYSAGLPPLASAVPGLFVCNSARIVNASLSVEETVALANRSLPHLLGEVP